MKRSPVFGARSTADQVLAGIDLTGKHYLVTGGASGIGLQTASALAANGGHVIVVARVLDDARRACAAIGYNCSPVQCDLGDLDSVMAAAAEVQGFKVRLDAIVANAAVAGLESLSVRSGVERHFLVNHVGHFALIAEMAGLLRDGTGRIVVVSSSAADIRAAHGGIMFDNLAGQRFYDADIFYAQSKFANALYSKELSRRLQSRGVAVNSVDPGAVRGTALTKHSGLLSRLGHLLVHPFRRTPAQGAATSVLLAASPNASAVSGEFWRHCKIASGNAMLNDAELAQRLWNLSEEIVAHHRALSASPLANAA